MIHLLVEAKFVIVSFYLLVDCFQYFSGCVIVPCAYYMFSIIADNVDLGTACGKYFRVCCLSIIDPGKHMVEFFIVSINQLYFWPWLL